MHRAFIALIAVLIACAPELALADLTVNGQLKNATPEKLAAEPSTNVVEGRFYWNTTAHGLKYYNGTAWPTVIDTLTTLTEMNVSKPVIQDYIEFAELSDDPVTPPEAGKIQIYAKDDHKLYTLDSTGLEKAIGSGSGEKNYINGTNTAVGWTCVGDLDVVTTTTAAELPREHTTGTGIKITAASGTQSSADYCYTDFTLDDVDLNRKLKITWDQKILGTYGSGEFEVIVTSQADRTTALHTPSLTEIPAVDDTTFPSSFDSASTAALSLVIRATTDMTEDDGIVISDVVVGPGTLVRVPPVVDDTPYTPNASVNQGLGTLSNVDLTYRRNGRWMTINGRFTVGTVEASAARLAIPDGLTIATLTSTPHVVGKWAGGSSSATLVKQGSVIAGSGLNYLQLGLDPAAASVVSAFAVANGNSLFESGQTVSIENVSIPIAEWTGSGLANIGLSADPEYAYNTSTSTSSDDSTSFAAGKLGAPIQAITAELQRRVRFPTAIMDGDRVFVELSTDRKKWVVPGAVVGSLNIDSLRYDGSNVIGVGPASTTGLPATDINIRFGKYRSGTSLDWSGAAAYYWRAVKVRPGQPVGFGAATETSAGLVSTTDQTFAGAKTFTGNLSVGATGAQSAILETTGTVGANSRVFFGSSGSLTSGSPFQFARVQDATGLLAEIGGAFPSGTARAGYLNLLRGGGSNNNYFYTDSSSNFRISNNSDHIGTTSGTVVGTQTSDERLKQEIEDSPYGLEEILELRPRRFEFKTNPGVKELGFIAQETQEVIPEAVYNTKQTVDGDEDILAMDYSRIIPATVTAIKQLKQELDELKGEFEEFKAAHP